TYGYDYYEGKWYRGEAENNPSEFQAMIVLAMGLMYDAFTYDETEQGYVAAQDGSSVVVKVVDGKLCGMKTATSNDMSTMIFYGYGEAEVELPEDFEEGEPNHGGGGGGGGETPWGVNLEELLGHYTLAKYVVTGGDNEGTYVVGETMDGQLVTEDAIMLNMQYGGVAELIFVSYDGEGHPTPVQEDYLWGTGNEPFTFVFTKKSDADSTFTASWTPELQTFVIQLEDNLYAHLTKPHGGGPIDNKYPEDVRELLGTYRFTEYTFYPDDGESEERHHVGEGGLSANDYVIVLCPVDPGDENSDVQAAFTTIDDEGESTMYTVVYRREEGTIKIIPQHYEEPEEADGITLYLEWLGGNEYALHINYEIEGGHVDIRLARNV
ncbi:MAG: hypothetical protein K2N74_01100, partial [Clostridiales bacterium]|nr:hypothetical protein [Clostridiales bacterium]